MNANARRGLLRSLVLLWVAYLLSSAFYFSTELWFSWLLQGSEREFLMVLGASVIELLVVIAIWPCLKQPRDGALTPSLKITALIQVLAQGLLFAILLSAAGVAKGQLISGTKTSLLFALTHFANLGALADLIPTIFQVATLAHFAVGASLIVLSTLGWRGLPLEKRRKYWNRFDVVLSLAFIVASLSLPWQVAPESKTVLPLVATRLTISALFALRLIARLLPYVLSWIERIGFHSLVAARHLRTKKTQFLAAISALTTLAVAISCAMLTAVLSVMGGFRADLKQKVLAHRAHIVVDSGSERLSDWEGLPSKLGDLNDVTGVSPYVEGEVMIDSVSSMSAAVLRGIDPATIAEVKDLEGTLIHGSLEHLSNPAAIDPAPDMLPIDDAETQDLNALGSILNLKALEDPQAEHTQDAEVLPGVILGRELAKNLRVVVGDSVTIIAPFGALGPMGPLPKSRRFRVAAISYSGMYEYDVKSIYTLLEVGQSFLGTAGAISGIEVRTTELETAPSVASAIRKSGLGNSLRVRDWKTLNRELFGALAIEKFAMFITLGIAVIIAGFGVLGTLTLLVQEKRSEVGVLKTLGSSHLDIMRVFMLEGLLIGCFGAATGIGLGYCLAFFAEHFGVGLNPEIYYIDRLPVQIDPLEFAIVGGSTIVVCILATIAPALQAAMIRPLEALRD